MHTEIDLTKFKVIYNDKVLRALSLRYIEFPENIEENATRVKPKFICIWVINEDGNIESIYDKAWRFQFTPIIKGE